MGRYGRKVAAVSVVVSGAMALAVLACSRSEIADPAATPVPPVPPVQQVAGDLSYRELLPPSRQGIAPSLQYAAVTRAAVTPTPRPVVSEALARRIAEQEFARGVLNLQYPEIDPAGTFLATRTQLIELDRKQPLGFPVTEAGDGSDRYWVVNFLSVNAFSKQSRYVGAVIDAQSGNVVTVFSGEALLSAPRLP